MNDLFYKTINKDCLEVMQGMKDNSVDLIVTDPPYLVSYKTARRKNHKFCNEIYNDTNNEQNQNLIKEYIKLCYRIMKDNTAMYMFCCSKTIDFFKQQLERYFDIKNIIIWVKNNWTVGDLKCQFGQQYEMLVLVNKGRCQFNGKRITDIWNFDKVSGRGVLHQNQKPIDLIERCIEKHSKKGDIVFDGFMGSGTTGVACKNLGRSFIGCEIDNYYFKIADTRINGTIYETKDEINLFNYNAS